jgi:hypothetical protein
MRKIIVIGLVALTSVATLVAASKPARADFGDVLIGAGAALGINAIVQSNNRANQAERQRYVSPQDEYYRGVQDGTNGLKYDNPRNSPDYDQGYNEGVRRGR